MTPNHPAPHFYDDPRTSGVTSLSGIAAALTERGIPTARGGSPWTAVQVRRVLECPEFCTTPIQEFGRRAREWQLFDLAYSTPEAAPLQSEPPSYGAALTVRPIGEAGASRHEVVTLRSELKKCLFARVSPTRRRSHGPISSARQADHTLDRGRMPAERLVLRFGRTLEGVYRSPFVWASGAGWASTTEGGVRSEKQASRSLQNAASASSVRRVRPLLL